MIIIKVELHSAITNEISEIGRAVIFNDGSGSSENGNYGVRIMRRGTTDTVQREASVKNHARLSQPIWKLIKKALDAAGF